MLLAVRCLFCLSAVMCVAGSLMFVVCCWSLCVVCRVLFSVVCWCLVGVCVVLCVPWPLLVVFLLRAGVRQLLFVVKCNCEMCVGYCALPDACLSITVRRLLFVVCRLAVGCLLASVCC